MAWGFKIFSMRENFKAAVWSRRDRVRQVARAQGIADSTVHRWETGATVPSLETIERLAQALEIDPLQLLMSDADLVLWDATRALVRVVEFKNSVPGKS